MKFKFLFTVLFTLLTLPAFLAAQAVIPVAAGDDQIDDAFFTAQPGDTLELTTSGGIYNEQFTLIVDKAITIRAAADLAEKPVWTCDEAYMIRIGDDLTLEGIFCDGAQGDTTTKVAIRTRDSADVKMDYNLKIDNCEFVNFDNQIDDGHAIYGDGNTYADSVIITNSYFAHIRQEMIRFKSPKVAPGSVKYFKVENCTFWDSGDEAIYVEAHDGVTDGTPDPVFIVNHVTIHNSTIVDKIIYPKEVDGAIVKNCIITQSEPSEATPVRIYGTNCVAEHLLFMNTKDYVSLKEDASVDHAKLLAGQEPYYNDPDNGDFAVAAGSPAATFADDGTALGDTNNGTWDADEITLWEMVKNNDWITLTKNAVTAGDTIMFVSDSGSYMTPNSGYIPSRELTLMAKPGLQNKPVLSTDDGGYIGKVNANLTVIGLAFDGQWISEAGDTSSSSTYRGFYLNKDIDKLVVEDCDFYNWRGNPIESPTLYIDTLLVNNSTFTDVGGYGLEFKDVAGILGYAEITNSSFYNMAKHAIYTKAQTDTLKVSSCTFYDVGGRGVYAHTDTNGIVIRDNIFMGCGDDAVRVYGSTPIVEYNDFWNNANDINSQDTSLTFPTGNLYSDPLFEDTSATNFSLALATNSPCVGAASDDGNMGDPRWGTYVPTAIADLDVFLPVASDLYQNYPNPFNPSTTIKFDMAKAGHVKLGVYNILGQEVATLLNSDMEIGSHSVQWNASNLATGVYFYKIEMDQFVKIKKMLLVK